MDTSEIDNLLAEKLFGWKMRDGQLMPPGYFVPRGTVAERITPPNFSADRAEAQKVWDKMIELGGEKFDRFLAEMPSLAAQRVDARNTRTPGDMVSAEEICRAALKALDPKAL